MVGEQSALLRTSGLQDEEILLLQVRVCAEARSLGGGSSAGASMWVCCVFERRSGHLPWACAYLSGRYAYLSSGCIAVSRDCVIP